MPVLCEYAPRPHHLTGSGTHSCITASFSSRLISCVLFSDEAQIFALLGNRIIKILRQLTHEVSEGTLTITINNTQCHFDGEFTVYSRRLVEKLEFIVRVIYRRVRSLLSEFYAGEEYGGMILTYKQVVTFS